MKKVPNLLKQAGNGIACALRVLFRLYTPDLLDTTVDSTDMTAAAAVALEPEPESDSVPGPPPVVAANAEGADLQVLPPQEAHARQELAEGCVACFRSCLTAHIRARLATHTHARALCTTQRRGTLR